MTIVDHALGLAAKGFHIFPVIPNGKTPVTEGWQNLSTFDQDKIRHWWNQNPNFNIGIDCGKFNGSQEFLVGIDVDNKDGKKGDETLFQLENMEGVEFPLTFSQTTPTGGRHLIYKSKTPFSNSRQKLGPGIDVRGKGGYLVGAGSIIGSKQYYRFDFDIIDAPDSLLDRLKKAKEKTEEIKTELDIEINPDRARKMAIDYLLEAPTATEGDNGDDTTYMVAAHLKDFGLKEGETFNLMISAWNNRCSPPWDMESLEQKVRNAYRYGSEDIGVRNPEVIFQDTPKPIKESIVEPTIISNTDEDPYTKLNKEFAFIVMNGKPFVLWDKKDDIQFMTMPAFHLWLKSKRISTGDGKTQALSQIWLSQDTRRQYEGVCFEPKDTDSTHSPRLFNIWRGFKVNQEIADKEKATESLSLFVNHVRENVCQGNLDHFNWLMCFFAHMIQRPYEKPIVAVVLRGLKGVGKNILVETIGHLLGSYFTLASNQRYLLSNFNSHLEKCLMFVLDEAFWSGDKKAEGTLKDIITGKTHIIERKGNESYSVKNLTRVCILGNETWLVPASHDERRFAVFDVLPTRRNDKKYFRAIMDGMKLGGYKLLFDYLMSFDLTSADIDSSPNTSGLKEQKINSLQPLQEFWFESLKAGRVLNSDFAEGWTEEVSKEKFREAYLRYRKEKGVNKYAEAPNTVGKQIKTFLPLLPERRISNNGPRMYWLGSLDQARKSWEHYIGHDFEWEA